MPIASGEHEPSDDGFLDLIAQANARGAATLVTVPIGDPGTRARGPLSRRLLFDYTGRHTRHWLRVFPYTRTTLIAAGLVVAGIALAIPLVVTYAGNDWKLERANSIESHLAVTGLAGVIVGSALFVSTLVLHGAVVATGHLNQRNATSVR